MKDLTFQELNLTPNLQRAIDEMGFIEATSIQSQVIPIIRNGDDVIGRSQTGTGKTIAFAIPAVELILNSETPSTLAQVLVLCPTRELTQQACVEIRKLTKYTPAIKIAEVYGGESMIKQITQLRTANIVVGTPGRIMDHMRRRTLKLNNLHMIILDEADEMLSMGFKEDIETILLDAPEKIQTVLFSATMPKDIMDLTQKMQNNPKLVEINKAQVTLDNIQQNYFDVPMGRKTDALALVLKYYTPIRALIFCNTKRMVDEVVEKLSEYNFDVQGLHGDMKQTQRTQVMDAFKQGKITILVATDVAARGIDVKDIDYVVNYDIPQTNEYYVHRIGRTGRAGREGCAITICSGRRQIMALNDILRETKSSAKQIEIPTSKDIQTKQISSQFELIKSALTKEVKPQYNEMIEKLVEEGNSLQDIAASVLQLHLASKLEKIEAIADVKSVKGKPNISGGTKSSYCKLALSIGRSSRIAPNHIVGAIAEKMNIAGSVIGKIDIFDQFTNVEIPEDLVMDFLSQMNGCKICGKPVKVELVEEKKSFRAQNNRNSYRDKPYAKNESNNHSDKRYQSKVVKKIKRID
ncbi:MAG: DEAD/DEAH box helicase [Oscillospiraceae bacterium]